MRSPALSFLLFAVGLISLSNSAWAVGSLISKPIPITIVSRDGLPLANVRVFYGLVAEKYAWCRNGSPVDPGKPCWAWFTAKKPTERNFPAIDDSVFTAHDGKAQIPAHRFSMAQVRKLDPLILVARNPRLVIMVASVILTVKSTEGVKYACPVGLPLNAWTVEGLPSNYSDRALTDSRHDLDQRTLNQIPRAGLKFTFDETLKDLNEYSITPMLKKLEELVRTHPQDLVEYEHCEVVR